jgi:murein L,D-transpeptidase YafK
LTLYENGEPVRTYLTTIGRNPSAKDRAGDWATPEGLYYVRRKNPESKYHLALHISYPNNTDAERGLSEGIVSEGEYNSILAANARHAMPPQDTSLGYYIEIHGGSNRVTEDANGQPQLRGWTRGCMGLRNADIEAIYAWAPVGTPVFIAP